MRIALHEISVRVVLSMALSSMVGSSALAQTPVPVSTSKEVTVAPPATANSLVPDKAAPQKVAPAQISPDTPIATIQGICGATSKVSTGKSVSAKMPANKTPANTCKTVITRAQMDSITDLLIPDATPDQRHQFALNYIRMVAASNVALEKHLDHDPAVAKEMDARLQFARTQVMASSLYRRVEKLAEDVQEKELNSYYSEHSAAFTQAEIDRIVLMKSSAAGSPVDQVMLKAKADELQARAAKGEDFEALQKEAAALNAGTNTSWMKAATVVRAGMPPAEGVVFDVKPGEVTKVVDAPGAFEILKLVSLKPVPLDSVRNQLKTALTNGHLQLLMKDATKGVTANFNLAYLNLTTAPELFLAPSLRAPNGAPMGPGIAQGPSGIKRPQPRSEHSGAFPVVPNQAMPPQQ